MYERPPGIRRLCIAMDVDRVSSPSSGGPREVVRPRRWRRDLGTIVDELCQLAEMDRAHWNPPVSGGGEIAVLPPGIDEGRVVATVVRSTHIAVERLNDSLPGAERVRLRVAMHQGITHVDESGFSGRAVVKSAQLRDSPALRAEFARCPDATFALAVSAELFDDVVEHDYPDLRGRDFRRVRVSLAPGRRADAWFLLFAPPAGRLTAVGWPGEPVARRRPVRVPSLFVVPDADADPDPDPDPGVAARSVRHGH